ncbi:MAG: cyanoexosortase A [Pseudanabaenales cyanobacterium]|nr:cyanoexosortase A [Pseudanabaenales cyanobacterium]
MSFWLLSLAAGLIVLHLNLTWRSDNNNLLSCSLLFWLTTSYLVWEKRDRLNLASDIFSSFCGLFLITLVLVKSTHLFGDDVFLRISPVLSVLGLGLLASGVKGVKQYWRELLLWGFIAAPWESIYLVIDLSLLTAKFTTFVLWLLGFDVSRQGVLVILPTGSIEVYDGCSGLKMILQLLGIALIFVLIAADSWKQKILLLISAIILGFVVNGVRVALMTILVALSDQEAFIYWHLGNGSLIFSLIAVLIFGLIYILLNQSQNQDNLDWQKQ